MVNPIVGGPPKISFDNFDPLGSFQKGQQYGLQNRARAELAKCAPDDFGCMTKVLMSLDPEQGVRAAQLQNQLAHQRIMEGQGQRALDLRVEENKAQAADQASDLKVKERQVGVQEQAGEETRALRRDAANKEFGGVVSAIPGFVTARDNIAAGGWNLGSTRQGLMNFATAVAVALKQPDPHAWANDNVPGTLTGAAEATKVLQNLASYAPIVAQRAGAVESDYTEDQFNIPEYVSPEQQKEIERNPPTVSTPGKKDVPMTPSAVKAGVTQTQWNLMDPAHRAAFP